MTRRVVIALLLAAFAGPVATSHAASAPRPLIDAITCRTACGAIDAGAPGSVVQISGANMAGVTQVQLLGGRGARDDRFVSASASPAGVTFTIPRGARTGPLRAIGPARSLASSRRLLVGRRGRGPRPGALLQSRADVRRALTGAAPSVSFFLRSKAPLDVAVAVVRPADGAVVYHFVWRAAPGRSTQSVTWPAIAAALQPEGRYEWRVLPLDQEPAAPAPTTGAATASAAQSSGPAFSLVRHAFPIVGSHTYGTGAGRFGAQRAGHIHQGQDVFASCGTPLVAVSGAVVKYAGFEALAGNYIVLAADDGNDYAYMHMRAPATLKAGDPVAIGAPVGNVGDTGDAVGCHLHFEVWPGHGWQTGSPVDPLAILKSWDA